MIESLIETLIEYVRQLGGLGILLGVALETFIAPIPSPLIPMSAGFILVPPDATIQEAITICFTVIALFGAFGATAGAFFGYAIGYYGGRPLVEKYGRYLGFSWKDVEEVEKRFGKRHMKEMVLIVSRAVPVIPLSPVSFFAGFIRYNTLKFALFTFIGALPRYFFLGLVGWWAGLAYSDLVETIGDVETLVLALMVVGVVVLYAIYRAKRKDKVVSHSHPV